jgi:hypothetical protein
MLYVGIILLRIHSWGRYLSLVLKNLIYLESDLIVCWQLTSDEASLSADSFGQITLFVFKFILNQIILFLTVNF